MYTLIRDKNNIFHVILKKKCKKRKHSCSFEDSEGNIISGQLECSNDNLESLRSIQKNLALDIPRIPMTLASNSLSPEEKLKRKITVLDTKLLKNWEKLKIVKNNHEFSEVNLDESNSSYDSAKLTTSTPNTSGTLKSNLKLRTILTTSQDTNVSTMSPASKSQVDLIDVIEKDNSQISSNRTTLLSTPDNSCLNDRENSSCQSTSENLISNNVDVSLVDSATTSQIDLIVDKLEKNDSQFIFKNTKRLSTFNDSYLNDSKNLLLEKSTDSNNNNVVVLEINSADLINSEKEKNCCVTIDDPNILLTSYDPCLNDGGNFAFDQSLAHLNNDNLTGIIEKPNVTEKNNFDRIFYNSQILDLSEEHSNLLMTIDERLDIGGNTEKDMAPENGTEMNDSDPSYHPENESATSVDENFETENHIDETASKSNNVATLPKKNKSFKGFDVSLPQKILPQKNSVEDDGSNLAEASENPEIREENEDSDTRILIKPSNSGSKVHACFYCMKLQTRLPRHLELMHSTETDVQAFLVYPLKSKERFELISKIRNDGDYKYNNSLTGKSLKNRIVSRPPNISKPKEPTAFAFCPSCQVSVAQKSLSAHFKYCTGLDGNKRRVIKKMSKIFEDDFHPETSKRLRNLIVCMHVDEVSKTLKLDSLLIRFGNILCQKYKHDQQNELIRNRLRLLSKLLITTQKIEKKIFEKNNLRQSSVFVPKIKNMTCLFDPQHLNICVEAVNVISGTNEKNYEMKAPSVASLIGTLLKQLGSFLKCENITRNLKKNNEIIDDFLLVVDKKWAYVINKNVQEAQIKNKRQKKIILPTTEDITKLMDHLLKQQTIAYNSLQTAFSLENYFSLAETTLIIVQMFNRRRAGEMERVLWEDFELYNSIKDDSFKEVLKSISDEARKFCEKYVRFITRGKLGRNVSVLLDDTMFSAIQLLKKNRLKAGIRSKNPYIFGLPGGSDDKFSYLRACTLMRKYSKQCGATSPVSLRGTTLRKHIATYLVQHNAANIDRTKLANHLGHNMGIHENYYHLVNVADEICQLPRVLESACGAKKSEESDNDSTDTEYEQSDNENNDLFQDNSPVASTSINELELSYRGSSKPSSDISCNTDLEESLKACCRRKKWENRHIKAMHKHFSEEIKLNRYPTAAKMKQVCSIEPLLQDRAIPAIRTWFCNYYKKTNQRNNNNYKTHVNYSHAME